LNVITSSVKTVMIRLQHVRFEGALLAASVFHYRTFSIRQVKEYLREKGLTVIL
jgi:imidazole glycerol phosphate synthase subunit HisF